ncbi:hypothetical protein AB0I53_07245 [Saccharopolyspora sp. NPDC050389]|uniref:hypothetical protein n=1 Tax=Saccharopolyspora sp. NPDC050389 TaxID=3155516 RepID=UPI0033CD8283
MSFGRHQPDDWEYDDTDWLAQANEPTRASTAVDTVVGQDPSGVVSVSSTFDAVVVSVALADNWRQVVDPRQLHVCVVAAANAATMLALGKKLESADLEGTDQPQAAPGSDDSPLSSQDITRLLDEVTADLNAFTQQLTAIADQTVTAESPGRNVSGTAQRGQILQLSLDPNWASAARKSEIETELASLLATLQSKSTPTDLAGGPRSRAIDELNDLASNPQLLLRRLGLGS